MHAMYGGGGDVKCVHSGLCRQQMCRQNATGEFIDLWSDVQFFNRT